MLNVNVSTLVFGTGETQKPLPKVKLRLVSKRVAAKTIITQAVEKQFNALLADKLDYAEMTKKLQAQYLEQSEIDTQRDSGKIALAKPQGSQLPILENEIKRALNAFKNKSFKMFVDGEEILNLNDECTLVEGANITFIRLVPLVGG